ncbi:dihydroorotase [Methylobacterium nodulans]|uniref:Amidohydrolase n=1 Tax=Methylobacterium nodulans (strain LMG 21967 / CNCM I-2342 / ORS 2060) TaxID=460265 RepID=B8IWQ7_METNO|nr:dihydroorotase family protein [Methylobacterium nodulans]ACL62948.1 amidohydrolase [Methylobacterium nodulans ORS 2060]
MSTDYDLLIRGGEAVLPGRGRTACDIAVRDGRIAAILAPGAPATAPSELDARGLVVMPGAIDVHLHLGHGRDIARPRVPEDAARESAAAASGGITCFIPYLMTSEPFSTVLPEVIAVTQAGSRIDFSYHPIISTEEQLAEVERCAREFGAPTFKIFMNNRGGEGARLGLPDIDDGFLLRLCEAAARAGGMVCPHPETIELAWVTRDRAKAADPDGIGGLATWNASRPPFVEADAVQRAGYVAKTAGAPLYVVHTSSAEALAAGLRQRQAGATLFLETCPHYLTHDIGWTGGDLGKINPPLREAADREALWAGILSGAIDTIATDHVHRGLEAKAGGIWAASPGCPGLETLLPVLLSEGYHARGLSLERVVDLVSTNPARLMGLAHRKGAIAPGLDADLAVIDLDAAWTFDRGAVLSSAGYSLYEGWQFRGRVVHTAVRGHLVLRDGALQDERIGIGRYVSRSLATQHRCAAPSGLLHAH